MLEESVDRIEATVGRVEGTVNSIAEWVTAQKAIKESNEKREDTRWRLAPIIVWLIPSAISVLFFFFLVADHIAGGL